MLPLFGDRVVIWSSDRRSIAPFLRIYIVGATDSEDHVFVRSNAKYHVTTILSVDSGHLCFASGLLRLVSGVGASRLNIRS